MELWFWLSKVVLPKSISLMALDLGKNLYCISSVETLCTIFKNFLCVITKVQIQIWKWHDFLFVKGQVPYIQEALHIQKTQEVYFLASNQCVLSVIHACLPDMIKQSKKKKKGKINRLGNWFGTSLDKQKRLRNKLVDSLGKLK